MLRRITEGQIGPEDAVRAYHGTLQALGIKPRRSLEDDMQLTDQSMSYDGSAKRRATVEVRNNPLATAKPTIASAADFPKLAEGSPDFAKMTSAQRVAYHQARLNLKSR